MDTAQALALNWVPLLVVLSVAVFFASILKTIVSDYRANKNAKK